MALASGGFRQNRTCDFMVKYRGDGKKNWNKAKRENKNCIRANICATAE